MGGVHILLDTGNTKSVKCLSWLDISWGHVVLVIKAMQEVSTSFGFFFFCPSVIESIGQEIQVDAL